MKLLRRKARWLYPLGLWVCPGCGYWLLGQPRYDPICIRCGAVMDLTGDEYKDAAQEEDSSE